MCPRRRHSTVPVPYSRTNLKLSPKFRDVVVSGPFIDLKKKISTKTTRKVNILGVRGTEFPCTSDKVVSGLPIHYLC